MHSVTCPCGVVFEGATKRARYCSPKCRQRASRGGLTLAKVRPLPQRKPAASPLASVPRAPASTDDQPAATSVDEVGSVVSAAIAELAAANALQSAAGLAAVKLAQLIDGANEFGGGTSVATWSREMRAALADATSKAPVVDEDPIERLQRRARRGA